jgi:hypothetical protein
MEKEPDAIPNFDTIRPILYSLFVPHVSSASLLISYYYLSLSEDTVKVKDIGEQAKWCIANMPRFSKLAKVLRIARNKLEHHEFFSHGLLHKLYKQVCLFYELEPNILVKNILDTLNAINGIASNYYTTSSIDDHYCPVCGRGGPKEPSDINITHLKLKSRKHIEEDKGTYIRVQTYSTDSTETKGTLYEFKYNPILRSKIRKGVVLKVLDGDFAGQTGVFNNWNGNHAKIVLEKDGIKHLNINRQIEILSDQNES